MKSKQLKSQLFDEGWRQIRAGVALIIWSRLVEWNADSLTFASVDKVSFESSHAQVHHEFGRLICWIAFGVGSEYLVKGACLLNGRDLRRDAGAKVIRLPSFGEDIEEWIRLVNTNDPRVHERDVSSGTLGTLPVGQILKPGRERDLVLASIKLLASTIRNRDAHRYAQNVRGFHFHVVESLFVPAFNTLLASLDQAKLRAHLSDHDFVGE